MRGTIFPRWILSVLLAAGLALSLCACGAAPSESLLITEVVSSNKQCLLDEAVGSPDWIELYNRSNRDIDLTGYGLSDNMRDFHKYTFPEGTVIRAGEYLVVYASENNGVIPTTVPCTAFGLSKSGDYLFLTDPYYNLLAEMQIPSLVTDVSYARRSDGSFGYSGLPSPGRENADADIRDSIDGLFGIQDYSVVSIS
ncbi:MAG: lamin tail domain-containing protein, partial [Oscillospiraceae bacterium]|nr:lamin tail domain-containing protein [Oscillospiraceae bacterium]